MSRIQILKQSITHGGTDIMVNAANSALQEGSGVCGAIFRAAGEEELQKACNEIGYCHNGDAVITPAFKANAKYIIHTVGPIWYDGKHHEPQDLYSCYRESLDLARDRQCHSISFPLISAGIFGYPMDKAWHKALQACHDWMDANPNYDMDIIFCLLADTSIAQGRKEAGNLGISLH